MSDTNPDSTPGSKAAEVPPLHFSRPSLDMPSSRDQAKLFPSLFEEDISNYNSISYYNRQINSRDITPKNKAEAYCHRGIVHFSNMEYANAMSDFKKSIEFNRQYALPHFWIGARYHLKKEYDTAIDKYSEAIELEKNPQFYCYRGLAYYQNKDSSSATEDYKNAIELNPDDAASHYLKSIAHISDSDPVKSKEIFTDLIQANKFNEDLKKENIYCHIASQINQLTLSSQQKEELNFYFTELVTGVNKLTDRLEFKFEARHMLAHYASLDTLLSLSDGKAFRVYNSIYMNDSSEGHTFFEVMRKYNIDIEGLFYDTSTTNAQDSPAYIGSFVMVDKRQDAHENGRLVLWCMYGKHNQEDAAGACLLFDKSQFKKHDVPLEISGIGSTLEHDISKAKTRMSTELPKAYRVIYMKQIEQFSDELKHIADALKKISSTIDGLKSTKIKVNREDLYDLVRKVLDNIRFLFKTDHFREEREIRIIKLDYHSQDEIEHEHKVEGKNPSTQLYMELPNLEFQEVILGPKVEEFGEWEKWLKKKRKGYEVRKSKIQFG